MCRKAGRRCPSHTNPEAIEERNEIRREQYAAKVLRDKTAEMLSTAGVKFHRGDEVKNAYFHGQEAFDPSKFEPVQDTGYHEAMESLGDDSISGIMPDYFPSKPEGGGLWTAPGELGEDGVKTAWTVWSRENRFRVSDSAVNPIRVRKQAIVVLIDNEDDLNTLCKTFPLGNGFSYEAMAKAGIDGVRLTDAGHRASKTMQGKIGSFSSWDLDSTVWINNENLSAGKPVKQAKHEVPQDDYYNSYDDSEDIESWEDIEAQLKASSETPIDFDEIDRNTRANSTFGNEQDEAVERLSKLLKGEDKPE